MSKSRVMPPPVMLSPREDAGLRHARDRSPLSPAPPTDADIESSTEFLRLLGAPARLRMLYTLHGAGERAVFDLAILSDTSASAYSHALRLLRAHGIVRARRDERMVKYWLSDHWVTSVLDLVGLVEEPQLNREGSE
ncbi:MAG: transcriptional regulator [Actinomycetota bacterium]